MIDLGEIVTGVYVNDDLKRVTSGFNLHRGVVVAVYPRSVGHVAIACINCAHEHNVEVSGGRRRSR